MLEIVIPMAGEGRRFAEAGYVDPKPLIDVAGKTMIERVIDSITPTEGDYRITLVSTFPVEVPGTFNVLVNPTRGAVDTLLQAAPFVDLDNELLVANCDQLIDWAGVTVTDDTVDDAGLVTFNSTNPHHSYVKTVDGAVTEIVEKQVISDQAVFGIYWFSTAGLAFKYARRALDRGERVNGEYYISSLLALMVGDGLRITTVEVDVNYKHMLGTPEELAIFLDKVADGRVRL